MSTYMSSGSALSGKGWKASAFTFQLQLVEDMEYESYKIQLL